LLLPPSHTGQKGNVLARPLEYEPVNQVPDRVPLELTAEHARSLLEIGLYFTMKDPEIEDKLLPRQGERI
jgi:hypothetical protein